jgi:stage II sporulation protein D
MKRITGTIILIMLTILFFPFVTNSEAEAANRADYVKVGLKYGGNSADICELVSEEGFIFGTVDDRSFNGNIVIRDEEGTLLSADLGSSGCIMPADYESGGILYLDGIPYRDGIMFLALSNGTMTVVNYITLEHYVYGVLDCELNHTNPKEALKAQAVAARSFAERNLGKHSAEGFDVCTSTHCQVYKGYSGEYPETNEAVDETEGEVMYYDGEPAAAFYFKNSGGYTQNSEDVWTEELPYLRAVEDEFSPSYPWSTSLSFDIIRTKLESSGFQPGSIESVSINGRNETGAVSELKIKGSDATVYLRKEKIRSVLGATIIKSNLFEMENSSAVEEAEGWLISDGFSVVDSDARIYAINGSGEIVKLDEEDVYLFDGRELTRPGSSVKSDIVTGDTVCFTGFGYGHGVGMPQDSIVEMAKQGFSYDEILEYYYTDIEID